MNKVFQLILRISILLFLVLTYLFVTRGKPITEVDQIIICRREQKLVLESKKSALFISKVEEISKSDTVQLFVYTKTISFIQSGPYHYEINLDSGIKVVQILDTALLVGEIEKCIE